MRRLNRVIMKNPKFSPAEEEEILKAEKFSTRATIIELGTGEYLKSHMPCGVDIQVARDLLSEAICYRDQANAIHNTVGRFGRKGRAMRPAKPAKKSRASRRPKKTV